MEVLVEVKCGRCGKTDTRSLTLEEAQALSAKTDAKDAMSAELAAELNSILGDDHPDVVIAIREGEFYNIQTLDSLCDAPDAKRNKGCKTRVDTLLGDIFMTNEPPKKKVVKKDPAEPAEPAEPEGTTE